MFDSVYCLVQHHNLWLVLSAACVCALATSTAFRLMTVGAQTSGRARLLWLTFAGACCGSGTWATHFIAMLAFDPGVRSGYDLAGTAASLGIAIAGSVMTMLATVRTQRPWNLVVWSVAFAATVGAMHYTGMAALRVAGTMSWNVTAVIASFVAGGLLSMLALWLLQRDRSIAMFASASACLAVGICTLHFIGMSGVTITPNAAITAPMNGLSNNMMALGVGGLTALIVLAAFFSLWTATRAQSASLKLLRAVIDAIPQGLAYFDAEDRFVLGNETYRRDLVAAGVQVETGLTYAEMMRRATGGLTLPDAIGRQNAWVENVVMRRALDVDNRDQQTPDGRFLRIQNNRAEGGGLVTVVSDITGLKRQTRELAAARDAAEAAARAKDDFLTNMSHELRTPMNGVIGVAELLAKEPLTPHQAELVDLIRGSSETLNGLICDILDLVKVKSGVMEIADAPFGLHRMTESARVMFSGQARQKGLSLMVDVDPALPHLLMGDEVRIKQVLVNLIANAVKFTTQGEVRVTVTQESSDGGASAVRFVVADTGVGFDDAVKQRLFTGFEQADASLTRKFGGAGLGLAICKELAVRMGGDLTCDSTPGVGSSFILDLPLTPASAGYETQASTQKDAPSDDDRPPRTLVVDDNATNRKVLTLMLEGVGVQTVYAENGQEALDLWRAETFDVILMDIQMPVMDGFTATREIRSAEAREGRARTPIIMVSANAMPEHLDASFQAGADDHVAKPVTAASLFAALGRLDHANEESCEDAAVA